MIWEEMVEAALIKYGEFSKLMGSKLEHQKIWENFERSKLIELANR